jgi:hypothetical protein
MEYVVRYDINCKTIKRVNTDVEVAVLFFPVLPGSPEELGSGSPPPDGLVPVALKAVSTAYMKPGFNGFNEMTVSLMMVADSFSSWEL